MVWIKQIIGNLKLASSISTHFLTFGIEYLLREEVKCLERPSPEHTRRHSTAQGHQAGASSLRSCHPNPYSARM